MNASGAERLLDDQFEIYQPKERTSPRLSYVICTAPRTGSTLLCSALWRTGLAGRPAEYFDGAPVHDAEWLSRFGITDQSEYFERAIRAGTTPNGLFGLKLHLHQAPVLLSKLQAEGDVTRAGEASDVVEHLNSMLVARLGEVRYIWLRRRNVVAQAISHYRAERSNVWWRVVGEVSDGPTEPVEFDFDAIHRTVQDHEQVNRTWYDFFMRHRLRTLLVVYEDFAKEYEKTVRAVLDYVGVEHKGLRIDPPNLEKLSDETSLEWEKLYAETLEARKSEPRYTPARSSRARTRPIYKPAKVKETLPLIGYDMATGIELPLEPGPPTRPWMDATPERFAYRCLPLVIANQFGWLIRNSHRLTVTWDGSDRVDGVRVLFDDQPPSPFAASHFGCGMVTFSIGRLFRTPPGYNLHVRGPSNWPKDGIYALEGIVETDWSHATFTMNWKVTRPNHPVTFEAGEPIAMIVPVPRGDAERFNPEIQPIAADAAWKSGYEEWSKLRGAFIAALHAREPEAVKAGWQRHYIQGVSPGQAEAPEHQTSLSLAPFVDKRSTRP